MVTNLIVDVLANESPTNLYYQRSKSLAKTGRTTSCHVSTQARMLCLLVGKSWEYHKCAYNKHEEDTMTNNPQKVLQQQDVFYQSIISDYQDILVSMSARNEDFSTPHQRIS